MRISPEIRIVLCMYNYNQIPMEQKNKEKYDTPLIEILEIKTEGFICVSKQGYDEEEF